MTLVRYSAALILLLAGCTKESSPTAERAPKPAHVSATSGQYRAEEAGRTLVGKMAPAITVKTIDGRTIDLSEIYGTQPIYIKFWATWCRTCLEQMPAFMDEFRKHGSEIQILAVNTGFNDDLESVQTVRSKFALAMPLVIDDGRLAEAFKLRVTPLHVVIGRSGRILYIGHEHDARLQSAIAEAIKQPQQRQVSKQAAIAEPSRTGFKESIAAVDGRTVQIDGAATDGKTRVILFLSPWCEQYFAVSRPAMAEDCRIAREAVFQAGKNKAVDVIGISSGLWVSKEDLGDFAAATRFSGPLILDEDGAIFRHFDVTYVPTVIVIGTEGKVLNRIKHDSLNFSSALSNSLGVSP